MTPWPKLPSWAEWGDTLETFHMWTQIVGKVRTKAIPWINHGWHVTLYVTPRGLTTGLMPHGASGFQIDFDFGAGTERTGDHVARQTLSQFGVRRQLPGSPQLPH